MHERVVWLGTEEPFAKAREGMSVHHGLTLSAEQIRCRTEEAGQVYEALQIEGGSADEASRGLRDRQMVCVDAAKVRVIGQGWCDAKTLTIGRVRADGSATDFSYFSRMMECHAFAQAARGEAARRGLAASSAVCAVMDGAEYNQSVVDVLRPDATRILDFYHAVEHLAGAGRGVWGEDLAALSTWLQPIRHTLRHGTPEAVLAQLADWAAAHPDHVVSIDAELAYFTKRQDQIAYAAFEQQGWPLGSGAGESAHKTVLQARMKRAGMSWAATNVNPMLALRNLTCSQRWRTDWDHIPERLRARASATASAPAPAATTQLPANFKLRPAVSWRDQPVGRARFAPSD
jgi:hypothetical protein